MEMSRTSKMKYLTKGLTAIAAAIALTGQLHAAVDFSKPIQINREVGDTLRLEERNRARLFQAIDNFRWAVFAVAADSTIYARIYAAENDDSSFAVIEFGDIKEFKHKFDRLGPAKRMAWSNSCFIASGYGPRLGLRHEVGYNLGNINSLALTIRLNDKWSDDRGEGKIGIVTRFIIPSREIYSRLSGIYISLEAGQNIPFLVDIDPDTYRAASLGLLISLAKELYLRPEFGVSGTTRNYFINYGDVGKERKTSTFFHIGLEFELKYLLRPVKTP